MLYKVIQLDYQRNLVFAFDSHLNDANTIWDQNENSINRLIILQERALQIIILHCRNTDPHPLICICEIIQFPVSLFISKSIHDDLPSIFINWFILSS